MICYPQSNAHLCASCTDDLQTKLLAQTDLIRERLKAKRAVNSAQVFVSVHIPGANRCIHLPVSDVVQQISVHVSSCVPQPLFKELSHLWCGLQEEAELLKILHNILLNLQPFIVSQAEIFPAAYLDGLLEDSEVKTDKDRMSQVSGTG